GVVKAVAGNTISIAYNDLAAAAEAFEKFAGKIACFCVEPVAGNMGLVPPAAGYLQGLRELCDQHGALLLFDEVMTGFRVAWGGAQGLFGINPDLTALGKIIGGGLPVGAYGGPKKLMEMISPAGEVYQAGTLSGNPLAMRGGIATLEILREDGAYEQLEASGKRLEEGLTTIAADHHVPVAVNRVGSMISMFFVPAAGDHVTNFAEATRSNTEMYARVFHHLLDHGIYLPPSQYETWFVSLAHTQEAIEQTLEAADHALAELVSNT
ncbi:MAG: aminotransferase class III-fold pyridoxal phosphate-dependent enzyme, partial [Phycisphaerae bacterium]|nr:aminotransferase class III-fold pyridoxal phosphate-dependent enzyme [Phycisphaerae bacterium]